MAEYYPLLARAVAGLKTSTPQARRAIYERARGALLAQLRAMAPPIPEPDIQRENDALDAAIARLEAEAGAAAPAPEEERARAQEAARAAEAQVAQAAAQAKAKAEEDMRAAEEAKAAAEAQAAEQARAAEAEKARQEEARQEALRQEAKRQDEKRQEQARREQAQREEAEAAARVAAERAQRQHAEQEARLAAEKKEREARERLAAEQAVARRREEIERAARAAEAKVAEAGGGAAAQAAAGEASRPAGPAGPAVPVKPPASAPHRPEPPPPPAAPDIIVADEPARDAGAAPTIAIRAAEETAPDRGDPFAPFAAARDAPEEFGAAAPELEGDQRNRPSRPAAPLPPPERPSHLRHIVAGAALALVMGAIGYAAWLLRDKPQELPRPKTAADTPAQPADAGGKIADRIDVAPSAPVPTVQAPAQTIRPAGAPATTPPTPAPVAPAQLAPARAAFLIQSDGPEQHKTYSGVVNWRVDNGAWRADISVPEVKLAVSVAMSKSADGGPASHKIDLRFQFDDPSYAIGRVGVPELRKEDNPYGDRLAAVAVPVTPNVYLIGLRKDDADIAYNLELIRSRGWIDIPIEMADKRIAKITFEKGPAGERTLAEAAKGW